LYVEGVLHSLKTGKFKPSPPSIVAILEGKELDLFLQLSAAEYVASFEKHKAAVRAQAKTAIVQTAQSGSIYKLLSRVFDFALLDCLFPDFKVFDPFPPERLLNSGLADPQCHIPYPQENLPAGILQAILGATDRLAKSADDLTFVILIRVVYQHQLLNLKYRKAFLHLCTPSLNTFKDPQKQIPRPITIAGFHSLTTRILQKSKSANSTKSSKGQSSQESSRRYYAYVHRPE
jgi:hypothetical protein